MAARVFVLGGSVAVGAAATSPEKTWHAVLEQELRRLLERDDIHVFNVAQGAFVTVQERLAFELAVLPRQPDLALFLDGANDALLPASSGSRPGDPYQTGLRYAQIYGNPLWRFLAENSAVLSELARGSFARYIKQAESELATDEERFRGYARAVASAYAENVAAVMNHCHAHGIACVTALQPIRAVAATALGRPAPSGILPDRRQVDLFDALKAEIADAARSWPWLAEGFLDVSGAMNSEAGIAAFTDAVHLNDAGQVILATVLAGPIADRLKSAIAHRSDAPPAHCRWVPPRR